MWVSLYIQTIFGFPLVPWISFYIQLELGFRQGPCVVLKLFSISFFFFFIFHSFFSCAIDFPKRLELVCKVFHLRVLSDSFLMLFPCAVKFTPFSQEFSFLDQSSLGSFIKSEYSGHVSTPVKSELLCWDWTLVVFETFQVIPESLLTKLQFI